MTEREDIDMTAAEYVLGTLDASARSSVAARRAVEPDLHAAIIDWERRLAPLAVGAAPVEPPADLWRRIEKRIEERTAVSSVSPRSTPVSSNMVALLERRVVRWRRAAIAATALAASLVVAIGVRESFYDKGPQNFVAVFQKDDAQPAFLMSVDLATRAVTIRPITADRQVGKTYQLWILAEPLGPVPRSLGLLDDGTGQTRKSLAEYEPALLQNATFGISVEPPGGSPTGRPTGPALHGKLHQAAP